MFIRFPTAIAESLSPILRYIAVSGASRVVPVGGGFGGGGFGGSGGGSVMELVKSNQLAALPGLQLDSTDVHWSLSRFPTIFGIGLFPGLGPKCLAQFPQSWFQWEIPKIGVPLLLIHFRSGFSSISHAAIGGIPHFRKPAAGCLAGAERRDHAEGLSDRGGHAAEAASGELQPAAAAAPVAGTWNKNGR